MRRLAGIAALLSLACLIAAGPSVVLRVMEGQQDKNAKWPKYPKNWYKTLKVGDAASYEMVIADNRYQSVLTIEKIKGSNVTFKSKTTSDGRVLTEKSTTWDVLKNPKANGGEPPPGSKVKKLGTETIKVGEHKFECTIFLLTKDTRTIKFWRSAQFPPIFSGGNVKMEVTHKGVKTLILLKSFKGTLLKTGWVKEGDDDDR